jgi:hypothetical protein
LLLLILIILRAILINIEKLKAPIRLVGYDR